MAPIFASPDIAALVAAYPPPLPSKGQPSLIRTYSKNNLCQSREILKKFRLLLEKEPNRIKLSDLPRRLGIETSDWILDCYDGSLLLSKDKSSIVSIPELERISEDFINRTNRSVVELSGFASDHEIAMQSLHELIEKQIDNDVHRFEDSGRTYIAACTLVDRLSDQIVEVASKAGHQKVKLPPLEGQVPAAIVLKLGREAIKQHKGIDGTFELEDAAVVFTPAAYASFQDSQRRAERETKIAELVQVLHNVGYCLLNEEMISNDLERVTSAIREKYQTRYATDGICSVATGDSATALVARNSAIDDTLQQLKEGVNAMVETEKGEAHTADARTKDQDTLLANTTARPVLARAVLQVRAHRQVIDEAYRVAQDRISASEAAEFNSIFLEKVAVPLQLYMLGISEVQDASLKTRLEVYTHEQFTREVIPPTLATLRERNLLHDKARAKEADKLLQAGKASTTLPDLLTAVLRLRRKQAIAEPTPELLQAVKVGIIRNYAHPVRRLARASDVLQHLIWVLLAQRLEGLVMSSGKDVSRMIKLFERSGGEASMVERLSQWRDGLKEGTLGPEGIEEMRAVAGTVLHNHDDKM